MEKIFPSSPYAFCGFKVLQRTNLAFCWGIYVYIVFNSHYLGLVQSSMKPNPGVGFGWYLRLPSKSRYFRMGFGSGHLSTFLNGWCLCYQNISNNKIKLNLCPFTDLENMQINAIVISHLKLKYEKSYIGKRLRNFS